MGRQGYISEFMNGGRILAHGKIESLDEEFSLPNNTPFSLYIRPKYSSSNMDAVLSVKCYQDDEFSDAPIGLNDWSPMAIKAIAANTDFLNTYDLYWGAGTYIKKV